MKNLKSVVALSLAMLMLVSCDANKKKIEEQTKLFIEAVNGNDKATIVDMYPSSKDVKGLSMPKKIVDGELTVEKDEKTGNYTASINNPRQQKIIFKVVGKEQYQIIDTYSVMQLDSAYSELAINTGVPVKKVSDLSLSKIVDPEGDYIKFLKKKFADVIGGNLVEEEGTYNYTGGWYPSVECKQVIRNAGSTPIKGSQYTVEFSFFSWSGGAASQTIVQDGVDLQPGEAYTFMIYPGSGWVNTARNSELSWHTKFTYKNQNPLKAMLKYAKFTGSEYSDFLVAEQKDKSKSAAKEGKKGAAKK